MMIDPVMKKKIPCREPTWGCWVCGTEVPYGDIHWAINDDHAEVLCSMCKHWELEERTKICVKQAIVSWIREQTFVEGDLSQLLARTVTISEDENKVKIHYRRQGLGLCSCGEVVKGEGLCMKCSWEETWFGGGHNEHA